MWTFVCFCSDVISCGLVLVSSVWTSSWTGTFSTGAFSSAFCAFSVDPSGNFTRNCGLISSSLYLKSICCKNNASTQFSTTLDSLLRVFEIYSSSIEDAVFKSDLILRRLGFSCWTCFSQNYWKARVFREGSRNPDIRAIQ